MNALVTGGAGFVGSHFVWAAREAGRPLSRDELVRALADHAAA